ncbi:MAG: OmpA family protein [Magnetococcales bacterium]|nr:OmpA family protein [Magnetococcales bacterium]
MPSLSRTSGLLSIFLLAQAMSGCTHLYTGPDGDRDGVPDSRDWCPESPRSLHGAVDQHGCPLDMDGDGVPNERDQCPATPPVAAVDEAGCPRDTDGDGVPDYRDFCPHSPTDPRVPVNAHGCPIDADQDGVPDLYDRCPKTPAFAETNATGCWIIHNLHFDHDKAELQPAELQRLERLSDLLLTNPGIGLEVHGHADATGGTRYNQQLSERRAAAIKAFLTDRGVAPERLVTVGFGAKKPFTSNATEQGRAKNRRGEFRPRQAPAATPPEQEGKPQDQSLGRP